jgi:threonine/homoserine/homoserine lactone efflux protein
MFESVIPFLTAGAIFGLSGGIAPGPTMTIIIAQAVRHGWRGGVKVALSPLITDGPIIVVGVLLLSLFREFNGFLGVISFLGACFLVYLAYESWTTSTIQVEVRAVNPRSILKGVVANFLNPSPYLFWFTIGCPMILQAYEVSSSAVGAFILSFFLGLVGTKAIIAAMVAPFRKFLETRGYVYVMRFLGLLLLLYAGLFFRDSFRAFGLW